jgi:GTPase Era involved in 16S rRNA processing
MVFPSLLKTVFLLKAGQWRADVVISQDITTMPWFVIEVKRYFPRNVGDWIYVLKRYLDALNCNIGIVISPRLLILTVDGESQRYDLSQISEAQSKEIYSILHKDNQPSKREKKQELSNKLMKLIEAVECAQTNDEKGKSLEQLAKFLFDNVPSLSCKYLNLFTRSSELDLVVEYNHEKGILHPFHEAGRYCLVECKNWSKPVGVSPVRDFIGKLDKCKISLGIIFSKNGVTGVDSGVDALREIQSHYDRNGVYLLVFSLDDVKDIS